MLFLNLAKKRFCKSKMYKILDGNSKYFDNKKLKFKPTAQNFFIPLLAVRVITKTLSKSVLFG